MNTLLFVLTLPLKPFLAFLVNLYHWGYNIVRYDFDRPARYLRPDMDRVIGDRAKILGVLEKHTIPTSVGLVLNTNIDHQCLRHGALIWALRTSRFFAPAVGGLECFIGKDFKFKRGIGHDGAAPPAMPMSVAFGIACALEHQGEISRTLAGKFLLAVEGNWQNGFTVSDSSMRMSAKSTAFDLVQVCSQLYAAAAVSPYPENQKDYRNRARLMLLTHGLLALEPITYRPGDRRYFIEHQMMYGAWTCYKLAPTWVERMVFRWILKRVYALSAPFANPYFAALADECGALRRADRELVVTAHADAKPWDCCNEVGVSEKPILPMNWSERRSSEFPFDGAPLGRCSTDPNEPPHSFVPLSGLTLSMALITLRRENGWGL